MTANRKAVFLDLQGTLGGEGLGDILTFEFFPNAIAAQKRLSDVGLLCILLTNQSHIAKGYFTMDDFDQFVARCQQELAAGGTGWDAVYCCPHTSADDCDCRKPAPGMVLQAQREFGLALEECYVVGDAGWDIALAAATGCKAVLVMTGLGESSLTEYRHTWSGIEPDYIAEDILDAANWILAQENRAASGEAGE